MGGAKLAAASVLLAAWAFAATACATSTPWPVDDPATVTTDPVQPTASPDPGVEPDPVGEPEPAFVVDGTAQQNAAWFRVSVQRQFERNGDSDGEAVARALVDAGFARRSLSWTASSTPTGLTPDAVTVAALWNDDCLVAQRRNGVIAVDVSPTVADGCLLGDVERF